VHKNPDTLAEKEAKFKRHEGKPLPAPEQDVTAGISAEEKEERAHFKKPKAEQEVAREVR